MSAPGFPAAQISHARRRRFRRRVAPLWTRLRVLASHESLDRLLLEGTAPVTTPELTLRSFQLTRASSRASLAASLEDALATAPARRRRSPSAAPLARDAIARRARSSRSSHARCGRSKSALPAA